MTGAAKLFSSGLIAGSKQIPMGILKSTTVTVILLEYALIFGTRTRFAVFKHTVSLVVEMFLHVTIDYAESVYLY